MSNDLPRVVPFSFATLSAKCELVDNAVLHQTPHVPTDLKMGRNQPFDLVPLSLTCLVCDTADRLEMEPNCRDNRIRKLRISGKRIDI